MWTLAQQAGEWWETVPAQIVLWGTALIVLLSVLKKMFGGAEFTRRLLLAMFAIGETDAWPNGSTSLPSSLREIYRRQKETHELVKDLRGELHTHIQEFENYITRHG